MARKQALRIASYNINGINWRLHVLLRWLEEFAAGHRRPAGTEVRRRGFPAQGHRGARLRGDLARAEELERSRHPQPGRRAGGDRRGLPGDPDDSTAATSRRRSGGVADRQPLSAQRQSGAGAEIRLQAEVDRAPARACAASCSTAALPAVLIGDFNVMPTDRTSTSRSAGRRTRCSRRRRARSIAQLLAQGWTDALRRFIPNERIYTFWDYWRNAFARDAGMRIDHLLLSPALAARLKAAGVDREPRGWEKTSDHAPTWVELRSDYGPQENWGGGTGNTPCMVGRVATLMLEQGNGTDLGRLNDAERQVLLLLAEGHTAKSVANELAQPPQL